MFSWSFFIFNFFFYKIFRQKDKEKSGLTRPLLKKISVPKLKNQRKSRLVRLVGGKIQSRNGKTRVSTFHFPALLLIKILFPFEVLLEPNPFLVRQAFRQDHREYDDYPFFPII
jgi:hypothetical protein